MTAAVLVVLSVLGVVFVVKILPLLIPEGKFADADLVPVYVPVPDTENPLPALIEAHRQVEAGQGTNHFSEIARLLDTAGDTEKLAQLIAEDTRHAAYTHAASFDPENWRYTELTHYSQPVPVVPEAYTVATQRVRWVEHLAGEGELEQAGEQWLVCLAASDGWLSSDGGLVALLIGINAHRETLSDGGGTALQILEASRSKPEFLERMQRALIRSDAVLRDAPALAFKREYLATLKSPIEEIAAGETSATNEFAKRRDLGSFKLNKTLNTIADEQRRVIASMAEPLDSAPPLREDVGDRLEFDFGSMLRAYLRGNAAGHVIVTMSQVTLGSMPSQFAKQRKTLRFLLCACAAKRFEIEQGRSPRSLEELVQTGFLEVIPADPFSGVPMTL